MATNLQFIEYCREQLRGLGSITYKKMFGEYMLYVDDKPMFLVCDNTVYVKMHEPLKQLLETGDKGYPYKGAKLHYIVDIDDQQRLTAIIDIALPLITIKKR